MKKGDDFGDRMKEFEAQETSRTFLKGLPVYARLDGRGFSRFTQGMRRPYDERMTKLMVATTKFLVEETHAKIGYTQSDEINLAWHNEEIKGDIFFNRKITKLTSVLASMATSFFVQKIGTYFQAYWGEKTLLPCKEMLESRHPHFDARVISFPQFNRTGKHVFVESIGRNKECSFLRSTRSFLSQVLARFELCSNARKAFSRSRNKFQ